MAEVKDWTDMADFHRVLVAAAVWSAHRAGVAESVVVAAATVARMIAAVAEAGPAAVKVGIEQLQHRAEVGFAQLW